MSADAEGGEDLLDDADLDDPWERMERLGGAIEIVANRREERKVTQARRLLQSLEQRIKEDGG